MDSATKVYRDKNAKANPKPLIKRRTTRASKETNRPVAIEDNPNMVEPRIITFHGITRDNRIPAGRFPTKLPKGVSMIATVMRTKLTPNDRAKNGIVRLKIPWPMKIKNEGKNRGSSKLLSNTVIDRVSDVKSCLSTICGIERNCGGANLRNEPNWNR